MLRPDALVAAYPLCVLAISGVLVLTMTGSGPTDGEVAPCRLEQEWSAGDAYDNELLEFERHGKGVWISADRHGERESTQFTWTTDRSTMVITVDGKQRKLQFETERRDDGCVLRFDEAPFPWSYREFYGR